MLLLNKISDVRENIRNWKKQGLTVALVPTMGALHAGHALLIRKAKEVADKVVVSIFVNPIQFGPNEDFDKYPRTIEADSKICSELGVDIIFSPSPREMYGENVKLSNDEVSVQILHSAVGGISESDVTLAKASHALIIGFNVRANAQARDMARRDDVEIKYYSIIYDVLDDIKKGLEGMLSPELREKLLGYAEIREVYNITGVGKVGGCMVTEGMVKRGAKIRLLRDNVVIHDGAIGQLKRFKDDVKEVKEGFECGISFENYNDIQKGDFIECYEIEEIAAKL